MKTKILILLILLLVWSQYPIGAQEVCQRNSDTISSCWQRLLAAAKGERDKKVAEAAAAAEDAQWEELTGKATGPHVPDAGLESATGNFLPLVRFAFAAVGLQDGLDRSALNFERKIGNFGAGDSWEIKIKGAVNDPDVFGPLKMAFAEDVRDQRVTTLKGQLEDLDDYSFSLDGNRSTESFGRTPNTYYRQVFPKLLEHVVGQDFDTTAQLAFVTALGSITGLSETTKFSELNAEAATSVERGLVAAVDETARMLEDLERRAADLGLFQVADLMNNQPQLSFSGHYRLREGAAGPDELSFKATYEHGFVNLNSLQDKCGDPSAATAATFATCYSNYIKDAGTKARLEHGDRLSITAEYNRTDEFQFAIPAEEIDLDLDQESSFVLTVGYARYIDLDLLGGDSSRIDLTGKYESMDDRGVVTLSYTNRLLQSLGGSIGISYANHERFLPESDKVFSAHFGLSFNAFPKNPPQAVATP